MDVNEIKTFDWDDEIEKESEFALLEDGDYDFEITGFERGSFDGSEKMPPCKMATVSFRIKDKDGNSTVVADRFYLCATTEWKLSQLFKSVGLKQTGKKARMDWNALPGSKGRCKVVKKKNYNNDNMHNEISVLYAADDKKKAGDDVWD